ncbi:MAG: Gfo/Idh/MocA family oxidoreductase [Clostridia bacterium]|nr:Gfo/Idh/MocA family oxidoreductase [Clostridia bacterium]
MIKVGVIGCGNIANSAHIPAYLKNSDVEIAYFCDIIPERAEKAVKDYGCGKAVTDYQVILDDPAVDAVSVCTPNKMHSIITIAALKAGKHVLCEKPAARTYAEAEAMQKTARETGKILNIGVVNRFNDAVNKIRSLIQNGELGDVFHVYVSFRSQRSIPGLGGDFTNSDVSGGGVLIDWGVHFLDIVMYCTGDPTVKTVSSESFCRLGKSMQDYTYVSMWAGPPKYDGVYDVEDSITGVIRTDGPVITFQGAWAQNIGENEMYIDFMGDKGGIRLQYGADFIKYGVQDGMLTKTQYQFPSTGMFQNEIDGFVRSIQTGEKLASHIDVTIKTARIMEGIYESARQHREVEL